MPGQKVAYLEADLRELVKKYGLDLHTELSGIGSEDFARLLTEPSPEPYWKLRFRGGFGDIFFLTTQGRTPGFAGLISDLAQGRGFPVGNIGAYIQPVVQGTGCHCEFNLYYDPDNRAEADLAAGLAAEAVNRLEEEGAFFSRPYAGWVGAAYRRAADTAAMQKKVKDIFDPNWVLNPGKLCF
jgi:FAD/FMN-containing dehydrogenase